MKFFKDIFNKLTKKEKREQHNHNVRHQTETELNKINSVNKKLSRGAAKIMNIIKSRGGWDSKVSGRERNRNHRKS
jgi:hypothetical protein